jgi:hypothetical protein
MAKKYTIELSEEERNTVLDCIRHTERQMDEGKRNTNLLPEISKAYADKQKSIFGVWEKVEHTKPQE